MKTIKIHISDLFQFVDNKSLADWLDVEEVINLELKKNGIIEVS